VKTKTVYIQNDWQGKMLKPRETVFIKLKLLPTGLEVEIQAPYFADPEPLAPPGSCDGLWDYEVVELFIAHGDQYTELELGPHGHYLLLQLKGIRKALTRNSQLTYHWEKSQEIWSGKTLIPIELLPPEPWTFNAYAIHGVDEERTYAALFAVPGDEPDFHRLHCFQNLDWD